MWTYYAEVLRVVDGDTLDLDVDLGFNVHAHIRVRLEDVDTPEIYGVKKESQEYKDGILAKEFVTQWLDKYDNKISIDSSDGSKVGQGKYGRWLVYVHPPNNDPQETTLNHTLVHEGYAKPVNY